MKFMQKSCVCVLYCFTSQKGGICNLIFNACPVVGWPDGAVVKALLCDLRGHKFDSRLFHCASCSHTCASVVKQYNLVPVIGLRCPVPGKATTHVGLALLWPCITDLNGLSTCGLKA